MKFKVGEKVKVSDTYYLNFKDKGEVKKITKNKVYIKFNNETKILSYYMYEKFDWLEKLTPLEEAML